MKVEITPRIIAQIPQLFGVRRLSYLLEGGIESREHSGRYSVLMDADVVHL
jgi:hypothetical protein